LFQLSHDYQMTREILQCRDDPFQVFIGFGADEQDDRCFLPEGFGLKGQFLGEGVVDNANFPGCKRDQPEQFIFREFRDDGDPAGDQCGYPKPENADKEILQRVAGEGGADVVDGEDGIPAGA
jgi:hypothetical protein